MALKITRAADPITVERLNMVLYGPPGICKTSLAFTAERPLLLDFDLGAHRASGRRDVVRIDRWDDVAGIRAADLAEFSTVVIDTAGRALDVLSADIMRNTPKHGRGGALTLQGYGELKARFIAFLKLINSFGRDCVLIAHMDEQRNGEDIVERLDVQGGSKGEIYKAADAMGRISIRSGQRVLNFSPTDAAFGKNPAQLGELAIPHFEAPEFGGFLGRVIADTKARLNAQTEAQRQAQAQLEQWRGNIAGLHGVGAFNEALALVRQQTKAVQAMFAKAAQGQGYEWDAKAGLYVAGAAAKVA